MVLYYSIQFLLTILAQKESYHLDYNGVYKSNEFIYFVRGFFVAIFVTAGVASTALLHI